VERVARVASAVSLRMHFISSKPELSERNFCDSDEMKLTSALSGIQQAGATAATPKSVRLVFLVFCVFACS